MNCQVKGAGQPRTCGGKRREKNTHFHPLVFSYWVSVFLADFILCLSANMNYSLAVIIATSRFITIVIFCIV